jgi:ketosteroid isomerase-like protein
MTTETAMPMTVPGTGRPERVRHIFNALTVDHLDLLDGFYDAHVVFEDPLTHVEGLEALRRYYGGLYRHVESIRFEFEELVEQGDTVIGLWVMHLQASGLRKGETIELPGVSHLRFDPRTDRVVQHRDYFDMGAFVYEHIPVLGAMVRLVNRKLREHQHQHRSGPDRRGR